MAKYRKLPVEIEAVRFTGNHADIIEFIGCELVDAGLNINGSSLYIWTNREGRTHVSIGDYIIKDENGEIYRCTSDIFEKTYEPAE